MYCTPSEYIRSIDDLDAKIIRIENIINLLYDKAEEIINNSGILEYEFDDSQIKVKTKYRNMSDIQKDIHNFETLLQMYINQRNGRISLSRNRNSFYRR